MSNCSNLNILTVSIGSEGLPRFAPCSKDLKLIHGLEDDPQFRNCKFPGVVPELYSMLFQFLRIQYNVKITSSSDSVRGLVRNESLDISTSFQTIKKLGKDNIVLPPLWFLKNKFLVHPTDSVEEAADEWTSFAPFKWHVWVIGISAFLTSALLFATIQYCASTRKTGKSVNIYPSNDWCNYFTDIVYRLPFWKRSLFKQRNQFLFGLAQSQLVFQIWNYLAIIVMNSYKCVLVSILASPDFIPLTDRKSLLRAIQHHRYIFLESNRISSKKTESSTSWVLSDATLSPQITYLRKMNLIREASAFGAIYDDDNVASLLAKVPGLIAEKGNPIFLNKMLVSIDVEDSPTLRKGFTISNRVQACLKDKMMVFSYIVTEAGFIAHATSRYNFRSNKPIVYLNTEAARKRIGLQSFLAIRNVAVTGFLLASITLFFEYAMLRGRFRDKYWFRNCDII